MDLFIIIFLLTLNGIKILNGQQIDDGSLYEDVENICEKCICTRGESEDTGHRHFHLDCSSTNLRQVLSTYPINTEIIDEDAEVFVSYSDNSISILKQIPPTEARLSLTFQRCGIQEIESAALIDVPQIKHLDLSWNNLTGDVLRPDIFRGRYNDQSYETIDLESINFSHNNIEFLDDKLFEHMPEIRTFDIAYNPLEKLDESTIKAIASLKILETLDLSYTRIEYLPDELFQEMGHLHDLYVRGNRFYSIPESLALLSGSLEILNVGDSSIGRLDDESFLSLQHIKYLYIDRLANLENIEIGTFRPLKSLEVLNCSENSNLLKFNLGDFVSLENLRIIDLSNSGLRFLDMILPENITFEPVENVTLIYLQTVDSLKLEGNPWHCDCQLFETLSEIGFYIGNSKILSDEYETRCETPYELAGDRLSIQTNESLCPINARLIKYSELPPFLRPRLILLTIISVLIVTLIGLGIGLLIARMKSKLRSGEYPFSTESPVRYSTIRESTISTNA